MLDFPIILRLIGDTTGPPRALQVVSELCLGVRKLENDLQGLLVGYLPLDDQPGRPVRNDAAPEGVL